MPNKWRFSYEWKNEIHCSEMRFNRIVSFAMNNILFEFGTSSPQINV